VRITQVELDNIKSYHHAVIPLREGTTAIRGLNGAGKSTLVEAIGFALFDAIQYTQAQFVREGEKSGQVAVTFISALDDREYSVVRRCGSSPAWYVYDPELGSRVVEQRADVLAFLRQHLRIEGEVELSALFTDALGVTQGTFTADFLLAPAPRKKKFDTLLQVEDYRKAAEKLNETRVYLEMQRREQELRIAELERETSQLPAWRVELEAQRTRARELSARLTFIQREAAELEARREELHRAETEVARLESASQVAAATLHAAEEAAHEAEARTKEAREAHEICATTQANHAAYLSAEAALTEAQAALRAQAALLARRGEIAQRLEGARRDAAHAERELAEATAAAQRVVELRPAAERQRELEAQLQEAQLRAERHDEQHQLLLAAQHERDQLLPEVTTLEHQLAALDALRPEAERLDALRTRLEALQAAQVSRAQHEQRLRANRAEWDEANATRDQTAELAAKVRANLETIRGYGAVLRELPKHEDAFQRADDDVRRLEAALEHHRLSREQSGQGHCPFLREPCLNIQRRGENSLASYFDRLIERDEQRLITAREHRAASDHTLQQLRQRQLRYDRLPEYEERVASDDAALAQLESRLARLAEEARTLEETLAAAPTAQALAAARAATKRGEDADRQLATYPELQRRHGERTTRLVVLAREIPDRERTVAALAAAAAAVGEHAAALAALGDPRAESAAQARVAQQRPQREAALSAAQVRAQELAATLAQVDAELAPFAGSEERARQLQDAVAQTRDAHIRYLRHEQLAVSLPAREAALRDQRQKRQVALTAAEVAQAAYETARACFDPALPGELRARAEALSDERGHKTAELSQAQEAEATLVGEIARVERLEREELAAVRAERQTLEDLEKMLQHFRETIKEAGPYIMRALLRQISTEANRIFGEILGDRSAQLSWEQDYEIVLRRDGRERTFALLSGGEQMSAALAVRLALLRSLSRLDVAFFDEPTQNMDGARRGNLAEQIRRIRGFEQLVVISHDDTFEQGLDSVIYLEKRNGETILVEADAAVPA
jgi:exonuclease SbcC